MARIQRTDIYNIDLLPSTLDYVIGTDKGDSLRTKNYLIGDLLNLLTGVGNSNGLLTGGVTWLQDLDFEVTDLTYILGETFYSADGATVTLDAADPTNPRIDLIVVDTSSAIYSITGTPAADPAKPIIADNTLELELTFVEVAAGATVPTGISQDLIYDENVGPAAEWTASENTSELRIDLGDTTQPNTGTIDIAVTSPTSAGGDIITFTSDGTHAVSGLSTLHFYIYLTGVLTTSTKLKVRFYNGASVASDIITVETGKYGLNISTLDAYQSIIIPTSEFTFSESDVTIVTFEFEDFPTGTFYIDTFNLVLGVSNPASITTFLGLSDTPSTYLGQTGKSVVVNTAETGLEFASLSVNSGSNFTPTITAVQGVSDVPITYNVNQAYSVRSGDIVVLNMFVTAVDSSAAAVDQFNITGMPDPPAVGAGAFLGFALVRPTTGTTLVPAISLIVSTTIQISADDGTVAADMNTVFASGLFRITLTYAVDAPA